MSLCVSTCSMCQNVTPGAPVLSSYKTVLFGFFKEALAEAAKSCNLSGDSL